MKICFDLDGTICHTKKSNESYEDVQPLPGAVLSMQKLKSEGHYLVISTARHMKTCNNNIGLIVAKQGKVLIEWLEKHKIPYDEIWFGKPLADLYVDDRGYKFTSWQNLDQHIKDNEND